MINKSNIGELTVEQKDFRVTIRQKEEHITQVVAGASQQAPVYANAPQLLPPGSQPAIAPAADKLKAEEPIRLTFTVTCVAVNETIL